MRVEIKSIPSALIIGITTQTDIQIHSLNGSEMMVESDIPLNQSSQLLLRIFNIREHHYEEFSECEFSILEEKVQAYSFVYKLDCPELLHNKKCKELIATVQKAVEVLKKSLNGERTESLRDSGYHLSYPYEKDDIYFNGYEETKQAWLIHPSPELCHRKWNAELAFFADSPLLYDKISNVGVRQTIQESLNNMHLEEVFQLQDFKRIYIGSEFCPHLLPPKMNILSFLSEITEQGYQITLALSYTTQRAHGDTVSMLKEISEWCDANNRSIEVCVNDFGIIEIIRTMPRLSMILGRMQNKRKKDPRIKLLDGYEDFYDDLSKNNLNSPVYQRMLTEWGIKRYEFEAGPIKNCVPPGTHSLHFPFYQINSSVYCSLYAQCANWDRKRQVPSDACPHYCEEFYWSFPAHLNVIGKGNSIMGWNKDLFSQASYFDAYLQPGIDRLVLSTLK